MSLCLYSGSSNSIKNMKITSKGFQFLLEDVNTQLWDFLLEYLEESEVRSLSLLFLSAYSCTDWSIVVIGYSRSIRIFIHVRFIRIR